MYAMVFLCLVSVYPVTVAQQAQPVAIVIAATEATVRGASLSSGSTVFSDELLVVGGRGYLSLQARRTQIHAGPTSTLRLLASTGKLQLELRGGTVDYSLHGPADPASIRVGDVQLVPIQAEGVATGQVRVLSNCATFVRVSKGSMRVSSENEEFVLQDGQSRLVLARAGVDYQDSPSKTSTGVNRLPPEFHQERKNTACGDNPIKPPADFGRGTKIKAAIAGGVIARVLWLAFESPDRP